MGDQNLGIPLVLRIPLEADLEIPLEADLEIPLEVDLGIHLEAGLEIHLAVGLENLLGVDLGTLSEIQEKAVLGILFQILVVVVEEIPLGCFLGKVAEGLEMYYRNHQGMVVEAGMDCFLEIHHGYLGSHPDSLGKLHDFLGSLLDSL